MFCFAIQFSVHAYKLILYLQLRFNPSRFSSSLPFLTANSSLGLALSVDFSMLRRKPTRLELKLDDIEEFESIRKDLEVRVQLSNP